MNFLITLYLISSISILAYGQLDRNRVTNSQKVEIDFDKECSPGSKPCLVKCCGDGDLMHGQGLKSECVSLKELGNRLDYSSLKRKPTDYSDLKFITADKKFSVKTLLDFHIIYRREFNSLNPALDYTRYAKKYNGIAEITVPDNQFTQSAPSFCFEKVISSDQETKKVEELLKFFVNNDDDTENRAQNMFIVYGGLVSAFFILLVLVVYGLLEKLRSNLHGMMLMVFMASLMAFWVFQSGTLIYEYKLLSEGFFITEASEVCKWICPITYFFILSTFFWMNVMCFDIWWTFRGTRKVREIHRRGIKAKFLTYSLYAFGLPCLVTIAAVAIDMSDTPISVSKPGFATCLHDSEDLKAKLYRFLPMMFLVTGNVILYTLTIYNIWAVKRHMAGVESTQVKKNKNQFIVYLKLSVIMGVSWIIELILTLIEEDSFPTWLFYLLNCFNIFSGVLIFFILVFKWSIFVMLYRRFGFENRWTRKISQVQASTRTDCDAKSTKSYAKTKSTDDSIVFESMALSHADTTKNNYSRISTSRV